jgi:hypothetical protein
MSKFLAMLKDSFREAVDGWIFTVMLILSAIVTLLVFSISYQATPTEQAIKKLIPESRQGQGSLQTVSPDRGTGTKLFVYFFTTEVEEIKTTPKGGPSYQDPVQFLLKLKSGGMGGSMEISEDKQPKKFDMKDLFRDPFQEAVRTWASPTGGEKVFSQTRTRVFGITTAQHCEVERHQSRGR